MNILITNDDGIMARGLYIISKKFQELYSVLVVAPDSQKSASSHSITLTRPIMVKQEKLDGVNSLCFSVGGTPVDCTKIAITTLSKKKIDLVVSGINDGFNLGTDVLYSGTVSAAIEGAINNIPAIALSCDGSEESYEIAAEYAVMIIKKIEKIDLGNIVLNINVPSVKREMIKGVKVCGIGERIYDNVYIEIDGGEDHSIYKITGSPQPPKENDRDVTYIQDGYVTITPLHYDLTNFKLIRDLEKIIDL